MNRIFIILFLVVTLVGAGLIVLLTRERDRMSERLVRNEVEQKRLESEVQALRGERDRLRNQLQQLAAPVTAVAKPKPESTPAVASSQPASADQVNSAGIQTKNALAEMMKNPAMKEMMKQQQIAALDSQYAGLFAQFQLDDAEKADFKQLLGERTLLHAELGLKMIGTDVTPEQRNALVKEHQEAKKASDARIRDFLNNDGDFASFQQWEDTKAERMQLDMGRSLFAGSGEALTPQQEQQLVNAMHQVRTKPGPVPDLSRPENFDPARLNQAEIDRQLARYDADARAVVQAAAGFLSPKQLESLRTLQQQWRSMSETGMRMSVMMFQNGAKPAAK